MPKDLCQLAPAYLDGELTEDERLLFEDHLRRCATCETEVSELRDMARRFTQYQFSDITERELRNLHAAVDAEVDRPIWRIIGTIGAIAASILIVSGAWLVELQKQAPEMQTVVATRGEPWEQVAMTLRPDPIRPAYDQSVQFADARLADWMLQGLSR